MSLGWIAGPKPTPPFLNISFLFLDFGTLPVAHPTLPSSLDPASCGDLTGKELGKRPPRGGGAASFLSSPLYEALVSPPA